MSLREDERKAGGGVPRLGTVGSESARTGRTPAATIADVDIGRGIYVNRSGRGMQPPEGAAVHEAGIGTGPRLGPSRGRTDWRARALALSGAVPLAVDARLVPPLCITGRSAPLGEAWLHEIKWDGIRLLAELSGGRARLRLRDGQDWTSRFPELVRALETIGPRDGWLDGELVALDRRGRSDFASLQRAIRSGRTAGLRYIVFDMPALAGMDLTGSRLIERKRLLEQLLATQPPTMIVYGRHIVGHGERVFAASKRQGVEGIVSKRVDAPYEAGRTANWLKLRHSESREFVVIGYTLPKGPSSARPVLAGRPAIFDSLLVARPEGAGLRYAGRVRVGADAAGSRELSARLASLASATASVDAGRPARVRWVKPRLVVELDAAGRDGKGLLRQATLLRLRDDKTVEDLDPETGTSTSASA